MNLRKMLGLGQAKKPETKEQKLHSFLLKTATKKHRLLGTPEDLEPALARFCKATNNDPDKVLTELGQADNLLALPRDSQKARAFTEHLRQIGYLIAEPLPSPTSPSKKAKA